MVPRVNDVGWSDMGSGGFRPNYANPNKFAAGLRSTEDRNSDGYMGKRSTFQDPAEQELRQTWGKKFTDLKPAVKHGDRIREYENDLRAADHSNLNLFGNSIRSSAPDCHYQKYGYQRQPDTVGFPQVEHDDRFTKPPGNPSSAYGVPPVGARSGPKRSTKGQSVTNRQSQPEKLIDQKFEPLPREE